MNQVMPSQPEVIRFHAPLRDVQAEFLGKALYTSTEVERLLQDRFTEGWEAGQKSLGSQLVQQRADLLQLQNGVIASLKQSVDGVIADTEDVLGALVIEYVGKIVGEAAVSPEMIRGVISEALKGMARDCIFELRLHPEDLAILDQIRNELEISDDVKILADPSLKRGDCLVNTRFGMIDARRSTKLKNLEKGLSW